MVSNRAGSSQYEWSPDPAKQRIRTDRVSSPILGAVSPKKPRRSPHSRSAWSREQIILLIAFLAALIFGYVASTLLWQPDLLGVTSTTPDPKQEEPPKSMQLAAKMDAMDARATTGIYVGVPLGPPYTRSKYLQYFRSIAYGEASLLKHGGHRAVDMQMAHELWSIYSHHQIARVSPSTQALVEDDLWQEMRHHGRTVEPPRDLKQEKLLRSKLNALIARELEYDPAAPIEGFLANLRSPMAFQKDVEASLSLQARRRMCPALETDIGKPLDPRRRILFILGAQKAGTTYLFNALMKHPGFIGADHAYAQRKGPWSKEVHFFNRWPLPENPKKSYLSCFPSKTWRLPSKRENPRPTNFTLVDATPDYMFNTMAAPRIKAMWPHAKFLVLLRDPVARVYSAWKMSKKMQCREQAKDSPMEPCRFPSFAEMVLAEMEVLEKQGCEFNRRGHVFPKTWADCYGCKVTFPSEQVCQSNWQVNKQPCHAPPFLTLSVSMYAAQLSWWLGHFPKSQFMFVTSDELRDYSGGNTTTVLNRVLGFMGMKAVQFKPSMMQNVWGYNGGYNVSDLTPMDLHTVRYLKLFYRQADLDLKELLSSTGFQGIPEEFTTPFIDEL